MNLDMGLEEGKDKIDSFYITPNYVLGSISKFVIGSSNVDYKATINNVKISGEYETSKTSIEEIKKEVLTTLQNYYKP